MFKQEVSDKFGTELGIEFLQCSYRDHEKAVLESAEGQLCSLGLVLPRFNTLACLTKKEFHGLMIKVLQKSHTDSHKCAHIMKFIVFVGIIMDTLTCMISHSTFYEEYATHNKTILHAMSNLLSRAQKYIIFGFSVNQLSTFIQILEKSINRVGHENDFCKSTRSVIDSLKSYMQKQSNKENKSDDCLFTNKILVRENIPNPKLTKMTPDVCKKPKLLLNKHSLKTKKSVLDVNQNSGLRNAFDYMMSPNKQTKDVEEHAMNFVKDVGDKPKNAFDFMMMSSKQLAKKKKKSV